MICENDYCIYWDNNECILNEIHLNNMGVCESCISITISEKELKRLRKEQLEQIEALDAAL